VPDVSRDESAVHPRNPRINKALDLSPVDHHEMGWTADGLNLNLQNGVFASRVADRAFT
jgi:hypothetical protein